MAINSNDPHLAEHLAMIIDAFEQKAYQSNQRNLILAVAENPLSAMDNLLAGSETLLRKLHRSPDHPKKGKKPSDQPTADASPSHSVDVDLDLADLIASTGTDGEAAANYLRDCLNCDTRLHFDWQIQPMNLLGPIQLMLNQIKASIAMYKTHLDPFKTLEGLCGLLNATNGICIPDLMMGLVSIKMLLKHYTTNTLNIRLDWTSVFGPLLKGILEGIVHLLNGAVSIMAAPLDCMVASLSAAAKVEKETRDIIATIEGVLNGDLTAHLTTQQSVLHKSAQWQPAGPLPQTGTVEVDPSKGLPTGFTLDAQTTLEDALKDNNFAHASFIEKLILPIQNASMFVKDLLANLTGTLDSLSKLTSGGLVVNLDNLGIILFLMDTVSLIIMMVKMRQQNPRVSNWCDFLSRNPSAVESMLSDQLGRLTVEQNHDNNLTLRNGPDKVGEIYTCANQRSDSQNRLVQQWVNDLKRKQQ